MSKIVADNISPRGSDVTIAGVGTFSSSGVNLTGIVTASSGFVGNVTGDATGLSGSPTLSGITSVSTTNLTVNGNAYPAAGPLSNRNLIINGAMQIWQRSTSVTGVADNTNEGYQSVDRFGLFFGSTHGGACTISESTTVPSGEGFAQSYKVDVTTSSTPTANQSTGIYTKIEAQDIANSGWDYTSTSSYVTLSFWARSTKAGTYCVYIDSQDAATYEKYVKEYTLVANTWKKVEVTVPGKSTLAYNNDKGIGTQVQWTLSAGSSRNGATNETWETGSHQATSNQVNFFDSTDNDFYLTGVQLEVGEVATPFEHRSYGDELHRCQRYFYKIDGSSAAIRTANGIVNIGDAGNNVNVMTKFGVGSVWDGDDGSVVIPLPVTMRADPTTDSSNIRLAAGNNVYNTTSTIQDNRSSIYSGSIQIDNDDSSGMTSGQACMLVFEGDAYLSFSSEL